MIVNLTTLCIKSVQLLKAIFIMKLYIISINKINFINFNGCYHPHIECIRNLHELPHGNDQKNEPPRKVLRLYCYY